MVRGFEAAAGELGAGGVRAVAILRTVPPLLRTGTLPRTLPPLRQATHLCAPLRGRLRPGTRGDAGGSAERPGERGRSCVERNRQRAGEDRERSGCGIPREPGAPGGEAPAGKFRALSARASSR